MNELHSFVLGRLGRLPCYFMYVTALTENNMAADECVHRTFIAKSRRPAGDDIYSTRLRSHISLN
jgi:hypothetical protein